MLKLELIPDLDHCIETVARKEYNDTVHKLLSVEEATDELKNKAEILRQFLETADFKKLRVESELHLLQGKQVRFTVYLKEDRIRFEIITLT